MSGQQAERADRLKIVASSTLDGETQDGLERFARFINKDRKERKPPSQAATKKGLPAGYRSQIEMHLRRQDQGTMLDITI